MKCMKRRHDSEKSNIINGSHIKVRKVTINDTKESVNKNDIVDGEADVVSARCQPCSSQSPDDEDIICIPSEDDNEEDESTCSDEIMRIIDRVRVPDDDAEIITKMIICDLNSIIQKIDKSYEIIPFGSHISGLASEDSDLDFYLKSNISNRSLEEARVLLHQVAKPLYKARSFQNIVKIHSARVPIIKTFHKLTKKHCDISFSNEIGVRNSVLVKYYMSMNDNLKPMVIFLKFLLRKYKLHGPQRITTYMLCWLSVYYMQQQDLVPPVHEIRKLVDESHVINGWDCRVPENYSQPMNDPLPLFLHVKQFLEFYANFEFLKCVISPYLAWHVQIDNIEKLRLPQDRFSQYMDKVNSSQDTTFSCSVINLQDPTEHNINITKQVTLDSLNQFKSFCYLFYNFFTFQAADKLRLKPMLTDILPGSIPKEVHRDCIQYYNISLNASRLPDDHSVKNTFQESGIMYFSYVLKNIMQKMFDCDVETKLSSDVKRIIRKSGTLNESSTSVCCISCVSKSGSWRNIVETNKRSVKKKVAQSDGFDCLQVFYILDLSASGNEIRISVQSKAVFIRYLTYNLVKFLLDPNSVLKDLS